MKNTLVALSLLALCLGVDFGEVRSEMRSFLAEIESKANAIDGTFLETFDLKGRCPELEGDCIYDPPPPI